MIRLVCTASNRRARDRGRIALVIGRKGPGQRVFHLSEKEVAQLKRACRAVRVQKRR